VLQTHVKMAARALRPATQVSLVAVLRVGQVAIVRRLWWLIHVLQTHVKMAVRAKRPVTQVSLVTVFRVGQVAIVRRM